MNIAIANQDMNNAQAVAVSNPKVMQKLQETNKRLEKLLEVEKLQVAARSIEQSGNVALLAKLKPFQEHYGGDVVELLRKRTKQNFDKMVVDEVNKKGQDELAKFKANPDNYLPADQKEAYWNKAYDITVDEAIALGKNLQQALSASQPATANGAQQDQRRRLFAKAG